MLRRFSLISILALSLVACSKVTVDDAKTIAETKTAADLKGVGEYATVNGRRMYFEEYGAGPTVVLLHGGGSTIQDSFARQLPALAAGHRVIAIEQIGHGHTPDANIPFTYPQMAADTAALLHALKVKNADFIGWSDGGVLSLLIAREHPDLVRRLVISGANIRRVGMPPREVKAIQEASPQKLAEMLDHASQTAYAAVSPDGAAHWPIVAKKLWDLWLTPVILERDDLVEITAPTLVVSGDKDLVPIEHTVEIYKALPKAQLLVLPGTGHSTFETAAATLNPVLLSFIGQP